MFKLNIVGGKVNLNTWLAFCAKVWKIHCCVKNQVKKESFQKQYPFFSLFKNFPIIKNFKNRKS